MKHAVLGRFKLRWAYGVLWMGLGACAATTSAPRELTTSTGAMPPPSASASTTEPMATAPQVGSASKPRSATLPLLDPQGDPCAQLTKSNESTLAEMTSGAKLEPGHCVANLTIPTCFTRNGVTWGYRLVHAATGVPQGTVIDPSEANDPTFESIQCETVATFDLIRSDSARTIAIDSARELVKRTSFEQVTLGLRALADYDHDGELEFLRVRDEWVHEGGSTSAQTVMTYAQGKLQPYAQAKSINIQDVEDIDQDGLPDLITTGPYENVSASDVFGNDHPVGPAIFAWHALADGTFSMTDKAAVAYTRSKCPAKASLATVMKKGSFLSGAGAQEIVCARLRGTSEGAIVRQWKLLCGGVPPNDRFQYGCLEYPVELAQTKPPFTLLATVRGAEVASHEIRYRLVSCRREVFTPAAGQRS